MFRNASRPALTLAAVAVVQFMVSLDLSVVNVGLPQIAAGLGFGGADLTWVIHAYALTFGGLLLLGGKAADRHGRKRVLLFGLALFGLASLAGGFAQEPGHLIAARAVQGLGAAALSPAALSLLTSTFPSGRERVRAFGIWGATNAAGGALGVLIGGLLTQYAGWRWVMFVNVPMALVALALAGRGISAAVTTPAVERSRPDVLGALLGTAGLTTLVFGVVRTDANGWGSPATVITLAIAVALLAAFVLVERRLARHPAGREPLLRLGLFTNRAVAGANSYTLLLGAAMASSFYFISLYLQRVLDYGPARTGFAILPFALGVIAGSVLAVKLGYRIAPRTLMIGGGLLAAAGFTWFGLISADGTFLTDILGPSLLASIGFGLCLAPMASTGTAGVDPRETGTASGLLNSSRQIGASIGLAVLGTAAQQRTGGSIAAEALNSGYAFGFTLGAVLLTGSVLIALIVLPRRHPASSTITTGRRPPIATMIAGLGLTIAGLIILYVDHLAGNVLRGHIRAGYPELSPAAIGAADSFYLIYLSILGVLGILFWSVITWAVATRKRWAHWPATAIFLLASVLSVTNLMITDTSGDTGLPPLLGWLGLLPCVAGLAVVVMLWRHRRSPSRALG